MLTDAQQTAFWSKVDQSGDCWIWTGSRRDGYGLLRVGATVKVATHVSWEISTGNAPTGYQGDYKANMQDCVSKGRLRSDSRRHSEESIINILESGDGCRVAARKFGVNVQYVCRVRRSLELRVC